MLIYEQTNMIILVHILLTDIDEFEKYTFSLSPLRNNNFHFLSRVCHKFKLNNQLFSRIRCLIDFSWLFYGFHGIARVLFWSTWILASFGKCYSHLISTTPTNSTLYLTKPTCMVCAYEYKFPASEMHVIFSEADLLLYWVKVTYVRKLKNIKICIY